MKKGKTVGIVGARGMVGQVLMERMRAEGDFKHFTPVFFSTSQGGQAAPEVSGHPISAYRNANALEELADMDIILTCQGGDYTNSVHPKLRAQGWQGYWIDAASPLRMKNDAIIVLDPLNGALIKEGLSKGIKDFAGGNCTVSLMLLAIHGLIKENLVEWVSSMTYQAASGAGAANMKELASQMLALGTGAEREIADPAVTALELEKKFGKLYQEACFPKKLFGQPLAGNLLPWIDADLGTGQSKEEWKGAAEANKILGFKELALPVDGTCVRMGAMRCHSQGLTIKLKQDVPLAEIEKMIATANDWVKLVPNTKEASVKDLTPAAVSGTLHIAIGRLRKMNIGPTYLNAFTVGDQLLWGAAEPLRRVLRMIIADS